MIKNNDKIEWQKKLLGAPSDDQLQSQPMGPPNSFVMGSTTSVITSTGCLCCPDG